MMCTVLYFNFSTAVCWDLLIWRRTKTRALIEVTNAEIQTLMSVPVNVLEHLMLAVLLLLLLLLFKRKGRKSE